jgi:hypothetical protein
MTAERHAVHRAIFLSVLMVTLGSTAAAATKYVSAHVTTEAIVTFQYFICTLLCLPRILRSGVRTLRTERLGLHLMRGLAGGGELLPFLCRARAHCTDGCHDAAPKRAPGSATGHVDLESRTDRDERLAAADHRVCRHCHHPPA